jgi:hypothetical protein
MPSSQYWKSLIIYVFHVATSSRASVAVAAHQAPANAFIGGNDDSETESQCAESGIGGSAESDDEGGDADLAETVFDDTPRLDAFIQNMPSCGTRTGQSLVPMFDITALHFFEALFTRREICDNFIAATNSYVRAKMRVEWEDVIIPEFKVFLSLLL